MSLINIMVELNISGMSSYKIMYNHNSCDKKEPGVKLEM